jgi:type 1 glutamine amidotransferase/cytochrome c551/c552
VKDVMRRTKIIWHCWYAILLASGLPGILFAADDKPESKKIVLIAGKKSHGPVGNGIHDYPWSVRLLKVMLDNSNLHDQLRVEYHLQGWPEDPTTLDDADTIMVISDGRDGDKYQEAPHLQDPLKVAWIEKQVKRGCGFMTFHFSTFAPDSQATRMLHWSGGYFDWETDGERNWYSAIKTEDARATLPSPEHPVCRGIKPFQLRDEFYYNIRFAKGDDQLKGILEIPSLPGRDPDGRYVAWARQREDGGRGFGTSCGHFYDNWKNPSFRKLILNAIAWTSRIPVPAEGVEASFYEHDQITLALAGSVGTERAVVEMEPIKVLIVTGHQYPGHKWELTSPVIKSALERDPRIRVNVTENVEDLGVDKIREFDLLVFNYCNWEKPGLSDQAKVGFTRFLSDGGGLILVHFANGAFHSSLPGAEDSDWPEYRKICRRVWDHAEGKSGHDAYGTFTVEIHDKKHPITRGMKDFETIDELYFRQQGTEPIEILATARSKVTGKDEPMAFVYQYGKGRVMQTVLGHAAESLQVEGVAELMRRSAAWIAGRKQLPAELLKTPAGPPGPGDRSSLASPVYYVAVQPQETPPQRPGYLSREVRDRLAPGLLAQFAPAGEDEYIDARATRLAALFLAENQPVTPFLPVGRFRSSMTGYLKVRLRGDFRFQLTGTGDLELHLNGRQVLLGKGEVETVSLHKGYNQVQVLYQSPAKGDASFRLSWAGDDFDMEAIPPTVLFFDTDDDQLSAARELRTGRSLFASHHCRACHQLPTGTAIGGMQELERQAPSLSAVGDRLSSTWVRRWLDDPAALRDHVTMPRMLQRFDGPERVTAINDLSAYLSRLGESGDRPEAGMDVKKGELLFEDLGCISCHRLTQPDSEDYFKRTSLWFAGIKYRSGAMVSFLQAPRAHYPWSRMPDFRLDQEEAQALSAFIRSKVFTIPDQGSGPEGDGARGKRLVVELGCANCHDLGTPVEKTPLLASPFGDRPKAGCMAAETTASSPGYSWSDKEGAALRVFLSGSGESLGRSTLMEVGTRYIDELRCVACHNRDDRYADWPEVLFEEGIAGHPPENVPPLSWTGEKLRVDWMERLFAGTLGYKPRPWLKARMPSFPMRGPVLAEGLAVQHGLSREVHAGPQLVVDDVKIAVQLTVKNGGLDCRQCHAMGGEVLKMENQAHGMSFGYIRHRLRYDYYQRWMLNPLRFDPASKMPRFSADRRTTAITHILDGDAKRQFDALWHYLDTTRMPAPHAKPPGK